MSVGLTTLRLEAYFSSIYSGEKQEKRTDILTVLVFDPAPTDGVLDTELNAHVALMSTTSKVVLVFWSNICIWMERFRVHFDKIGHTNNPMLWKV